MTLEFYAPAPSTVWTSIVLAILALLGAIFPLPLISRFDFWLLLIAYVAILGGALIGPRAAVRAS